MTSKLLTTVSAAAFLFGAGVAPVAADMGNSANEGGQQSAQLEGKTVYDASGQEVGTVENVEIGADGAETAILSVGGFLGIGQKKISVSKSELQTNADGSGVTLSMTAEEIEAAPAHEDSAADSNMEPESY